MTASTASRLHSGQSDRVRLGTPVPIGVRWCFFRSRPGAQLGAGSAPSGRTRLTELAMVHAALDVKREGEAIHSNMKFTSCRGLFKDRKRRRRTLPSGQTHFTSAVKSEGLTRLRYATPS